MPYQLRLWEAEKPEPGQEPDLVLTAQDLPALYAQLNGAGSRYKAWERIWIQVVAVVTKDQIDSMVLRREDVWGPVQEIRK